MTLAEANEDDKRDVYDHDSEHQARVAQSLQAHDYVSFSLDSMFEILIRCLVRAVNPTNSRPQRYLVYCQEQVHVCFKNVKLTFTHIWMPQAGTVLVIKEPDGVKKEANPLTGPHRPRAEPAAKKSRAPVKPPQDPDAVFPCKKCGR